MESLQSIVHLDIARKYFSPQVLRTFADLLADNGIRQLELYFSDNQGFRFALDDMVFGKINLADALGDGLIDLNSGMRPDGSGRFLTENEMTEYIRYASERGLEIIPAFDMPAHMAAILRLVPSYCYRNSRTSLICGDIT